MDMFPYKTFGVDSASIPERYRKKVTQKDSLDIDYKGVAEMVFSSYNTQILA